MSNKITVGTNYICTDERLLIQMGVKDTLVIINDVFQGLIEFTFFLSQKRFKCYVSMFNSSFIPEDEYNVRRDIKGVFNE